jgi:hypothetical protein
MDKVGGLLDNVTQSCINALTYWCASYQKGEIAINSSRNLGLFVHKELLSWKPKPYRPIQRMLELNFLTLILDTNYVLRRQTDLRIISKWMIKLKVLHSYGVQRAWRTAWSLPVMSLARTRGGFQQANRRKDHVTSDCHACKRNGVFHEAGIIKVSDSCLCNLASWPCSICSG